MKNTPEEKQKLRRYLDDIYIREEAPELLDTLRDAANKDLLDEIAAEVWEASSTHRQTTRAEHEKYKKEAHRLLKKIAHGKRLWLRRTVYAAAGIAAIFCLTFGGMHYFRRMDEQNLTYTTAATSYGEKKQVTLPDGSRVVLNSCTSLRYPILFSGKERKVELNGEAYFRVARNEAKPFMVTTRNFDVRVLGTHFDVKSYPQDEIVSVNVESGKVQVDLPEAMMRLTAQEQVLINTLSGEYAKKKEEREVAVWIKGGLRFSSTPIRDVARELERVYNCRIFFAPGHEFTNLISGEHDNKDLESVLQSIEYVSGVKYKKK
ncbi:MAG: FecR domain-containing protein [Parabacteroides sp.]|nr:FecR domain-containing protein [Parabacteroides sp.]